MRALLLVLFGVLLLPVPQASAKIPSLIQVFRIQARIKTCDLKNAGTDADIFLRLSHTGQRFYLDKGENDFQRGERDIYDVISGDVRELENIRQLQVGTDGSDRWCIDEIELFLNNPNGPAGIDDYAVFRRKNLRAWLSNRIGDKDRITFSSRDLRNSPRWQVRAEGMATLLERGLGQSELEDILEAFVGNSLRKRKSIGWGKKSGSRWVSLKRRQQDRPGVIRFDLDLGHKGRKSRFRRIDVDGSMEARCTDGKMAFRVFEVDADKSLGAKILLTVVSFVLPGGAGWAIAENVDSRLRDTFFEQVMLPFADCSNLNPRFTVSNGEVRLLLL